MFCVVFCEEKGDAKGEASHKSNNVCSVWQFNEQILQIFLSTCSRHTCPSSSIGKVSNANETSQLAENWPCLKDQACLNVVCLGLLTVSLQLIHRIRNCFFGTPSAICKLLQLNKHLANPNSEIN